MPAYKCACQKCDCKTTIHMKDRNVAPICMECTAGNCKEENKRENPS